MKWKFGRKQYGKPTPASISNRIDFVCGALGVISGWLVTAQYIPTIMSDIFCSVSSMLVIPLLLLSKKYFGVSTERKRVSIKDVASIDDKKIDEKTETAEKP